jgi:hypothetical protein
MDCKVFNVESQRRGGAERFNARRQGGKGAEGRWNADGAEGRGFTRIFWGELGFMGFLSAGHACGARSPANGGTKTMTFDRCLKKSFIVC